MYRTQNAAVYILILRIPAPAKTMITEITAKFVLAVNPKSQPIRS